MSLVSGLVAQYDREFKANLGEDGESFHLKFLTAAIDKIRCVLKRSSHYKNNNET